MSDESGNGSQNEVVNAQFGEAEAPSESAETQKALDALNGISEPNSNKPDLSRQFAALSRKDRDLRARESQANARIAELEAKLASTGNIETPETETPKFEISLEQKLRQNPLQALEDMGISFSQLSQMVLNDGKPTSDMENANWRSEVESKYEQKFNELESKLAEKEEAEQQAYYDAQIQNFKSEIEDHVSADTEKYELISNSGQHDLIYEIIEEHYNETGNILPTQEAAEAVESYLEDEAKKYMKLKKFQTQTETPKPKVESAWSTPTLTNDQTAQSVNVSDKMLSREESLAALASKLAWNE